MANTSTLITLAFIIMIFYFCLVDLFEHTTKHTVLEPYFLLVDIVLVIAIVAWAWLAAPYYLTHR